MKKALLIILSISLCGCAPIIPVLCKNNEIHLKRIADGKVVSISDKNYEKFGEEKLIKVGMTKKELTEAIGPPRKVEKGSGREEYVYYTGDPRMFLIGIFVIGLEQYKFTFESDKLIDISYYSSTTWPNGFCNV